MMLDGIDSVIFVIGWVTSISIVGYIIFLLLKSILVGMEDPIKLKPSNGKLSSSYVKWYKEVYPLEVKFQKNAETKKHSLFDKEFDA